MLAKPSSCAGCALSCQPYGTMQGYVPADGPTSGTFNGVLVVLEAAGADEEQAGRPTVGKAGYYLWSQLDAAGITRDNFMIHNVLSCRPPANKLLGMPYTDQAVKHCAPNLDATITKARGLAAAAGRTFVIVALGRFAFKRLLDLQDWDPIMKADYYCYPQWSSKYSAWIYGAPHPSYLMQGNHKETPILQYCVQRALEVAEQGLVIDDPKYLEDPSPQVFHAWCEGYHSARLAKPDEVVLSFDIETPYKRAKSEEEISLEDDDDYIILRVSFAYKEGDAVSVPWQAEYLADIERLFAEGTGVGWNNEGYDNARIAAQIPFNLRSLDAMLAWHVLNTTLPKGLGFVTPFYANRSEMWKHLADSRPAYYSAKDADMALRNWNGIKQDLKDQSLWDVYKRHVVDLNEVLRFMSNKGIPLDKDARQRAEDTLSQQLKDINLRLQAAVPAAAKQFKVYQKTPKDLTGLVQLPSSRKARMCPQCGALDVKAEHFKSIGKKRLKTGEPEQACAGLKPVMDTITDNMWARHLEFKLSKVSLERYQKVQRHKPIVDRRKKTVTFDVKAIKTLCKQYPTDPLYPIIGEFRQTQKILGTYIGVTTTVEVDVREDYQLKDGEEWITDDSSPRLASGSDDSVVDDGADGPPLVVTASEMTLDTQ